MVLQTGILASACGTRAPMVAQHCSRLNGGKPWHGPLAELLGWAAWLSCLAGAASLSRQARPALP